MLKVYKPKIHFNYSAPALVWDDEQAIGRMVNKDY